MKYDAARAALEACVSVDEVKSISDDAAALAAYARQAKDKDLQKMAIDIRMRARRRLGEMMAAQKAKAGKNKGGRPRKTGVSETPVSLAEAGIDKNLARESRAAAALSPEAFEAEIESRKAELDARAESLEAAAEALAIISADAPLNAAFDEVKAAKRDTKAVMALYESLKADVAAHQRAAASWRRKAEKSALCKACKVNLERDDE